MKTAVGKIYLLSFILFLWTAFGCGKEAKKEFLTGIVLYGDSRQPQVRGFQEGLAELGYVSGKNIHYIIRNAKNDRARLAGFVKELANRKVDLLVAAGGLEADAMRRLQAANKPPVLVLYVNSVIERKLIRDRRSPGWEVTGVDNLNAEISGKRVELLHALAPRVRSILILYYKRIPPSRIGVSRARIQARKLGIRIDARAVTSRKEIARVMNSLRPGEADAMLTVPTAPIDNALKEHILPAVNRLKLPLMTHSRPLAQAGALAAYGSPFYDMGKQASRLADKIFRGVPASKIPFETPKKFVYTVNRKTLKKISLKLNERSRSQINEFISP